MLSEEINVEGTVVTVKKRLAEGGFGYIDLVTDTRTNAELCLKRCGIQNNESQRIVELEIDMLRKFRCENIVQIMGSEMKYVGKKKEAFILLEYCSKGHLLDMLNKKAGSYLSMNTISDIFSQVLKAMNELHSHQPPVTHRDIKLENILMTRGGIIKLCDFGSCVTGKVPLTSQLERSQAEEVINKTTTQAYRAPEMVDLFMREELTEKTDIWALGCILYTLCFISHPFQDAGNLGILSAKVTMPETSSIPETARTLITRMFDVDPEARPDIVQLRAAAISLSHGTSLPPFEISDEAKRIKAEREFSQRRRQELKSKKSHNHVPQRAPVQLNPNSAAARRLAAKRAGASPGSISPSPPVVSPAPKTKPTASSTNSDFGNFGNFDSSSTPSPTTQTQTANFGSDQNDGFASFDVNFDTDFAKETNKQTSDHLFTDSDDHNQIQSAPVTSQAANDMFFTDFDSEPVVSKNQDDGFGNFDDDRDETHLISPPSNNMTTTDAFFSSEIEVNIEEDSDDNNGNDDNEDDFQHSPFKNDQVNELEAGFEFFGDQNEESNEERGFSDMFGNMSVEREKSPPASVDFFSTSDTTTDNPFDDHNSNNVTSQNNNNIDLFGSSEESQPSQQQQTSNFEPPQHDPFDMFSGGNGGTTNTSSSSSAGANDLFSFSDNLTTTTPVSDAPASKTASVMEMFNKETPQQNDPFAQVSQQHSYQQQGYPQQGHQQHGYQQQGYQQHHQQGFQQQGFQQQGFQQQGFQQPQMGGFQHQQQQGGYGAYQQQQQQFGGVRQVNPAGNANKDPFGSLMGSLK